MDTYESRPVTQLLRECSEGDPQAMDQLFPIVYDQLRQLARGHLSNERPGHTLAATALVHEAYLRLADVDIPWKDRQHFLAVAATMLRRILVDHAKGKNRQKRGGPLRNLSLDEALTVSVESDPRILIIDEALKKLVNIDQRKAQIIELLFFGGLTFEETAEVTGLSLSTLRREVNFTKAWLSTEIAG